MPYIKQEDRELYRPHLEKIILAIVPTKESPIKTVLFSSFIDQILEWFIGPSYMPLHSRFDGVHEPTTEICKIICSKTPQDAAGHINYVISSVYWSLISEGKYCTSAKYGARAFLNGLICSFYNYLSIVPSDEYNWEQIFISMGVLDHIKHETYLRCTTPYEEIKIAENRPIITNGELS